MKATIRTEKVKIPTYPTGAPEKAPLFIEKRAYQGSTGKVYPLPVTEKICDEKVDREYTAVILENDYLYVMILPELGGRIQRAYDKTNGYDFVYYNEVIKPALVGLCGPWISGGIEFNWPQHHRPTTFSPVNCTTRENGDGSVTAFLGETDRMYGTRCTMAVTLYPDKAYMEIRGRLYNPTDYPQTFLWWANPAVPVNDHTFSVFPPDVTAVFDHGKRDVSTFPIATGTYYKADYSAGVDISRYKNIQVPTSYMAAHSDFDFIGNFDEGRDAGLLHVADHHISPGKKQWTWGCGDFGKRWDKNLTDENGPYIELMTGVFADNQPDFTWLKPKEEKTFTQYFMPYKTVGRVSNATKDAVLGVDGDQIKVYATAAYPGAVIRAAKGNTEFYCKTVDLSPETCFCDRVQRLDQDSRITVTAADGGLLCAYAVYKPQETPEPEPAKAMPAPAEIPTNEELYLAGQHLEQYRHATYDPADYYLEGLRRDPNDLRLNNAYGLLQLKAGLPDSAITHFCRAIARQTGLTPNPYSGECYYNLATAYACKEQWDAAYDAYYKSAWSAETKPAALYHLAGICCRKGEYRQALDFANRALTLGTHNMQLRLLRTELLGLLGQDGTAFLDESRRIDPLSPGVLLLTGAPLTAENDCLNLALDYMRWGLYHRAIAVLAHCPNSTLAAYYKGYALLKSGDSKAAAAAYRAAETMCPDYVFPNKIEEIAILQAAGVAGADGRGAPMACYYLGNLLYDKKRYADAVSCWQACVQDKPDFAPAYRNLSIAYYNKKGDPQKAQTTIEKAVALDPQNSRYVLEMTQLHAKVGLSARQQLDRLEPYKDLLPGRDPLYLAYIDLLNTTGQYAPALQMAETHIFHPWEGGEGKVSGAYKTALFGLAEQAMEQGDYEKAKALCTRTLTYPDHLGEGKLPNVPDHRAYYTIGRCCAALGDTQGADHYYTLATAGSQTPEPVRYYNDQPSDYIYYQGLAFAALGNKEMARQSFRQLIDFADEHMGEPVGYDYFAVSMPELEVYADDIQKRSDNYCRALRELGEKGLKKLQDEEN